MAWRCDVARSPQVQHVGQRTPGSVNRWRADLGGTADADEHLRFSATSGQSAHDLAAGVYLDHVGQSAGREARRGAFEEHAGKRLTASQGVFAAVVVGRQDKYVRVVAVDLWSPVTTSVAGELTGDIDMRRLGGGG